MSASPNPNDLTRQQLDELDTLLQRMLSLPLNGSEPAVPEPVKSLPLPELTALPSGNWRADEAILTKTPYLVAEPAAQPAPAQPTVLSARVPEPTWGPNPLARYGTDSATGPVRGVDAPALPMGSRQLFLDEPKPDPEPKPTPKPTATKPEPEATAVVASEFVKWPAPEPFPAPPVAPSTGGVPVVLWPVFALNWILEMLLTLTGPFGAVIRWTPTKHLLGFVGLVLLAAAGAWAARGMGWIAFDLPPLPLDQFKF